VLTERAVWGARLIHRALIRRIYFDAPRTRSVVPFAENFRLSGSWEVICRTVLIVLVEKALRSRPGTTDEGEYRGDGAVDDRATTFMAEEEDEGGSTSLPVAPTRKERLAQNCSNLKRR